VQQRRRKIAFYAHGITDYVIEESFLIAMLVTDENARGKVKNLMRVE
jgi:hypothetical protein